MSTGQLTALASGLAALVTAVTGLVALFVHTHGPAHQSPAQDGSEPGKTPQSGAVVQADQSRP